MAEVSMNCIIRAFASMCEYLLVHFQDFHLYFIYKMPNI